MLPVTAISLGYERSGAQTKSHDLHKHIVEGHTVPPLLMARGSICLSPYAGLTRDWTNVVTRLKFLGKVPTVRVPFLTSTIVESGAFSAEWVEQGAPIPLSRATFDAPTMLQPKKVAALVPFTEELFQSWSPAIQANVFKRALVPRESSGCLTGSAPMTPPLPGSP